MIIISIRQCPPSASQLLGAFGGCGKSPGIGQKPAFSLLLVFRFISWRRSPSSSSCPPSAPTSSGCPSWTLVPACRSPFSIARSPPKADDVAIRRRNVVLSPVFNGTQYDIVFTQSPCGSLKSRALANNGKRIAARIAIIAMTTSNSIRVKPVSRWRKYLVIFFIR